MATLEKIRKRGILLAVIIGLALLAFILGEFLNSGSTLFQQAKQNVAEIDGDKINIMDFQESVDQMLKVYQIEAGRADFNENEMSQIRNSVWESIINERILKNEAEKIGLTVSKEELKDRLVGKNIHPLITQRAVFRDPQTGQFSRSNLIQFYNNVFSNSSEGNSQELAEAKSYWLFWEKEVENAILQEKFSQLLGKTVAVNSIEAKYNFDARNESADINYIFQPYYTIPDSTVTVTKAEIKTKYDKNKKLYKEEANRSIKYVSFEVKPLDDDYKEAQEWMNKLENEFRTTNEVTALVNQESDKSYTGENYSKQTIPQNLKDFAFSNPKGSVFGPVFENDTYTMARIMETGIMESDSVKLRHIVLNPNDEQKADSLVSALKKGADFAQAAQKHSLAQQTAANGGEIGWITRQAFDKEMAETTFAKGKNEIFKISNPQGIQIFQILEKSVPKSKVKVAILERKVTPSNESYNKIYNDAKQFAIAATNPEQFEKIANEKGYLIRPAENLLENTENIGRIPHSRQIVKWAFENKKGTISDVFDCDRTAFVIANITEVNNKGFRSIEKMEPQLKAEIIQEKKGELMVNDLAKYTTLEQASTALKMEVKTAPKVNFSSYQFGDEGMEAFVIGKASVLPEGKVSKPLKGQAGVYIIQSISKTKDPTPYDKKMEAEQLNTRTSQTLPYIILQKLREKYNVVDNRIRFY